MTRLFDFLIRQINDIKIRNKLILFFIFIVFLPVLMVGLFLTSELRQNALDNAIEQTNNNVERVKKRAAETLKVPGDISSWLLFDKKLMDIVNRKYETTYEVVKAYREYPVFRQYLRFYKEISNVRLYFDNPTLINNWEFIQPDEEIRNSFWYQAGLQGNSLIGWYYIADETQKQMKSLSLVRRIDFVEYHTSGILVVNVSRSYLQSILNQESFDTMIVDDNNNIIATNRSDLSGKTLSDIEMNTSLLTKRSGTFDTLVKGQHAKVIIEDLQPETSLNGLRIVSMISIKEITKDADHIRWVGLMAISISVIVVLILFYVFSHLLTSRLLTLSKHINKVAIGNLSTAVTLNGNDEIGQLSRQFNFMVTNIKELMDEVEETHIQNNKLELKQNEIKLKMMASQINPHFLFNALESIRMKAHLKGDAEISNIVKLIGKLMRKSIEIGGRKIALSNEIDMVVCYLEIQKFRYEDRLSFHLGIDPACEPIYIPPLIIQPLVENAVIHGLEDKQEGSTIMVKATMKGDEVLIEVIDNGVGIPPERVDKINHSLENLEDDMDSRIGLNNVHQRLRLSYGEQYGLTIESQLGQGTRVYFTIPARRD